MVCRLNWANCLSECHSNIDTSLKVIVGGPVRLLLPQVLLDGLTVEEPVLTEGLDKFNGLGKDRSPASDSTEIIIYVFARGPSRLELSHQPAQLPKSFDVAAGFDLCDSVLDVGF